MGSGVIDDMAAENVGIIPRAVQQVFALAAAREVRSATILHMCCALSFLFVDVNRSNT